MFKLLVVLSIIIKNANIFGSVKEKTEKLENKINYFAELEYEKP